MSKTYRFFRNAGMVLMLIGGLMVFPPDESRLHDVFQLSLAGGYLCLAITSSLRKRMKCQINNKSL